MDDYERWYLDEVVRPTYKTAAAMIRKFDHIMEGAKRGIPYPVFWSTSGSGRLLLSMIDNVQKADAELGSSIRKRFEDLKQKHDLHDEWFKSH